MVASRVRFQWIKYLQTYEISEKREQEVTKHLTVTPPLCYKLWCYSLL